MYSENLTRRPL
jgi:hypothetical protein